MPTYLKIAVPPGIGDAVWSLMKVPALLEHTGKDFATVGICGQPPHRAGEFVGRFDFVDSWFYCDLNTVEADFTTARGVFNHAPTQPDWHGRFDWLLNVNQHLEDGHPLAHWQPHLYTSWDIADRYQFTADERLTAANIRRNGPYVVCYLGPHAGNTTAGHNRGELWTPDDWGATAASARAAGFRVLVVGADYDRSYFHRCAPYLGMVENCIGAWEISTTFAVIKQAAGVIAYQSGIGIFATLMGIPTAMWWREHGNSIMPDHHVTFREQMACAWVPPTVAIDDTYLPLIYSANPKAQALSRIVLEQFLDRIK